MVCPDSKGRGLPAQSVVRVQSGFCVGYSHLVCHAMPCHVCHAMRTLFATINVYILQRFCPHTSRYKPLDYFAQCWFELWKETWIRLWFFFWWIWSISAIFCESMAFPDIRPWHNCVISVVTQWHCCLTTRRTWVAFPDHQNMDIRLILQSVPLINTLAKIWSWALGTDTSHQITTVKTTTTRYVAKVKTRGSQGLPLQNHSARLSVVLKSVCVCVCQRVFLGVLFRFYASGASLHAWHRTQQSPHMTKISTPQSFQRTSER